MTWRGYHRAAVDDYIRELEDELAAVRTERAPEHAIREEIYRIGHDTGRQSCGWPRRRPTRS